MDKNQQQILDKYKTTLQGVKAAIRSQSTPKDYIKISSFIAEFFKNNKSIMKYEN